MLILTGFELKEDVAADLERYLDLETKELKIYLGLLSLGNVATLGQISLITGFDIIVSGSVLENLINKGYVSKFKSDISRYMALEPFLESYTKLFDPMAFAGVIRKLSKSLEEKPVNLIDNSDVFKTYMNRTLSDKKKEILEGKSISSEAEKIIESSFDVISDTAFSVIQDMETKAKKIQVNISKSFQKETEAIFQAINEARSHLIQLLEASREIKTPSLLLHDILVGESSILITLRDIITRARQSLRIFMVLPEIKSLLKLIELTQRYNIKIEVVGDIKKTPTSILEKVKTDGIGIQLRQLDEIDFWGVVMDDKELLFAPLPKVIENQKTEITGIFTTFAPLIQTLSEQFRKLVMRAQPIE